MSTGSAALDVGTDLGISEDFEAQSRPLGSGFDIGYDEADLITGLAITFSPSPTITVQNTATFTATVTAGSGVTYAWDFGDGTTIENGNPVQHTFANPGTYSVMVTATNSSGSVSISIDVEVVQGETLPPEYKIYLPVIVR